MNYTSIEQSKKLLELGLDANTADFHCIDDHYNIPEVIAGFCNGWYEDYKEIDRDYIPIWSVGALLEVMPLINDGISNCIPQISKWYYKQEKPKYIGSYVRETLSACAIYNSSAYTQIEVAYNMVVWLLENNYIKND